MEIEVSERSGPSIDIMTPQGMDDMDNNLKDMLNNFMPKTSKKKMKVPDAFRVLCRQEAENWSIRKRSARKLSNVPSKTGLFLLMKSTRSQVETACKALMFPAKVFRETCCQSLKDRP